MQWFKQLFTRRRRYDELSESIGEHLEEERSSFEKMFAGISRVLAVAQ